MIPFKSLALLASLVCACAQVPTSDLREYDIAALQSSMQSGELRSRDIVSYYLTEIARIDHAGPELRSIIEINPDAMEIAASLDRERDVSGPRGPLHGIPVVLKANIDTGDRMHTTAGSLALAAHRATDDAFLVARLRDAGAVILGKTNLSEWSNIRLLSLLPVPVRDEWSRVRSPRSRNVLAGTEWQPQLLNRNGS